jgi:hypothetical protein
MVVLLARGERNMDRGRGQMVVFTIFVFEFLRGSVPLNSMRVDSTQTYPETIGCFVGCAKTTQLP